MLKEVTGDILLTKAEAVAHGIAPNDNFGTGLALSLREQWPAMYKDFRHYCQTFTPKSGELWAWAGVGGTRIVNLFTQEPPPSHGARPGRATIENVNHCLKALSKCIETEKLKNSLRDLNDKIEEAKRKKNLLLARQRRAQAQQRIAETMSSMSDKSAFEANVSILANYDARNNDALQRLVQGGTKLRPYSQEILEAARDLVFEKVDPAKPATEQAVNRKETAVYVVNASSAPDSTTLPRSASSTSSCTR